VKFWDSSAILPLLVHELPSDRVKSVLLLDPEIVIWWATPVECGGALARRRREGSLQESGLRRAQDRLDHLLKSAYEIEPMEDVRARAQRLLSVHRLRAADALQLAAAIAWCRERPTGVGFVCLDDRLRGAALLEGFTTEPPAEWINDRAFPE
jgi:predicted nucleic acid-binding protein